MNDYGYRFFDSDESGFEERDISGDDLKELFDICFKYCEFMSLIMFSSDINGLDKLSQFRVERPQHFPARVDIYSSQPHEIQYFRLCPELKSTLIEISNRIFGFVHCWGLNNPEDPCFYRADGSVFLESEIHEGEVLLSPREGEDVSMIVSKPHWMKPEDYRNPFDTLKSGEKSH